MINKAMERELRQTSRSVFIQAMQAMRGDVVRGLVELITNSDDSYRCLEQDGRDVSGLIYVDIETRRKGSVIRVTDFAQGMSYADMHKKIGNYGDLMSGRGDQHHVRGYFGRGLKDCMLGLGSGDVFSAILGEEANHCQLAEKGAKAMFKIDDPRSAKKSDLDRVLDERISEHPAISAITEVTITVLKEGIRVPRMESLKNHLESHYELRGIVQNPARKIVLRKLKGKSRIDSEVTLVYLPPDGDTLFEQKIDIPGFDTSASVLVRKSNEPLFTPRETKPYSEGGFVVETQNACLDLTLFKFDADEYAAKFYGSVNCDYFDLLIDKGEPILTATRDGLDWKHPFADALAKQVEQILEPFVNEERDIQQRPGKKKLDSKVKNKLELLTSKLNSIAQSELGLGDDGNDDGGTKKSPALPDSGFGFVPEWIQVEKSKRAGLTIRASSTVVEQFGSQLKISCDDQGLLVKTPILELSPREDYQNISQALVEVEGIQVGAVAAITAELGSLEAAAIVKVVAKKDRSDSDGDPKPKKNSKGLFRQILLSSEETSKQRVYYRKADSTIVVSTTAPSVSMHIDENGDALTESSAAQVLLAELVTEAFCRELARRGVENGTYVALDGATADAIQTYQIGLQNKYAHLIHEAAISGDLTANTLTKDAESDSPRERRLKAVVSSM
jgi:hypothetical protein